MSSAIPQELSDRNMANRRIFSEEFLEILMKKMWLTFSLWRMKHIFTCRVL
jgi:hypothetical protein